MIDLFSLIKKSGAYKTIIADKANGRLSHAYLVITSDKEMGEKYLKILAKAIMCKSKEPCFGCRDCLLIDGVHPDVLIFPQREKTLTSEETASLIENVYLKPVEGDKKVIIINKAEEMSVSSQNKLLKTLEEPPENVHILLSASSDYGILPTVKSRSKTVTVPQFSCEELFEALKTECKDKEKLTEAVACSDGTVGNALALYGDESLNTTIEYVVDMLKNMQSSKDVLKYSEKINALKIDTDKFIDILESMLRDMLLIKENKFEFVFNKKQAQVLSTANGFKEGAIISLIEKANEAKKRKFFNANPLMTNEWLLFQILEVKYKWQKL